MRVNQAATTGCIASLYIAIATKYVCKSQYRVSVSVYNQCKLHAYYKCWRGLTNSSSFSYCMDRIAVSSVSHTSLVL